MTDRGRIPTVAIAVALGLAWALHDTTHATGLALGPGPAGWVTRAGALLAVAGGALALARRTSAGVRALAAGAAVVLAGSVVEWLLAPPAAPGLLLAAHEPRAVGAGLALLARVALPAAALAVYVGGRRRNSAGLGPAAGPPVMRRPPASSR